jgi:uncharacterized membrane protein
MIAVLLLVAAIVCLYVVILEDIARERERADRWRR